MSVNMHTLFYKNSKQQIKAVGVEPLNDYRLRVFFSNGEVKIFDVNPYLKYKSFAPIKDKEFFAKAKTQYNTVLWNDKIDIDPEELYWDSVSESPEFSP